MTSESQHLVDLWVQDAVGPKRDKPHRDKAKMQTQSSDLINNPQHVNEPVISA